MIPPTQQQTSTSATAAAELIPVRPGLKRERTDTSGSNRSALLSMDLGFIRSEDIVNLDGGLVGTAGGYGGFGGDFAVRPIESSDIVRDLIGSGQADDYGGSYTAPLKASKASCDEEREHALARCGGEEGSDNNEACPLVSGLAQKLERITTGDEVVPLDRVDGRISSADWVRDFRAEQSGGIGAMHPSMFGGPPVATSSAEVQAVASAAQRLPAPVSSSTGGYEEYDAPLRQSPPASTSLLVAPPSSLPQPPPLLPQPTASGTSPSESQTTSSTKRRRRKKKRVIDETRVVEPTDHDVLFGRGGFTNTHPGNLRFRQKALELRPWYESVSKEEKYSISDLLVESVKADGHRFLERGADGLWHEVIGNGARKKASQALRERVKGKRSAAATRQNNDAGLVDSAKKSEGPPAVVDDVQELIGDIEPARVEVENVVGV